MEMETKSTEDGQMPDRWTLIRDILVLQLKLVALHGYMPSSTLTSPDSLADSFSCTASAMSTECRSKGDPCSVQIFSYAFADAAGRIRRMYPCNATSQSMRGNSTTRGSDRNFLR